MTQKQYIISRKVNIVELGRTLGNISEACRRLDVSRQHYYDIKRTIEEEGLEGLMEKSRRSPRVGNRVPQEIEDKVLEYSLQCPTHGQTRTANELKKQGVQVSAGGVRSIWLRHNLQIKALRLKRLEKWAAENTGVLKEAGVKISMDGKGRAMDNIMVERLWRSLKYENIYLKEYETVEQLLAGLRKYFDFYNNDRPHDSLGRRTPAEAYFAEKQELKEAA